MASRNDELLRRWFEDIWNKGDIDVADELLAPKGVLHETAVGADGVQSLADFKAMARVLRQAIPDVHFRVDSTLQDGDRAAARLTVTGTHKGPGLGIAPTGRSFRISGIVMIQVKDGRTIEGWSSFDMLGLFEQLGAVKRPRIGADL
jgi:steroid delta-isomerase-like uncharacterized protein